MIESARFTVLRGAWGPLLISLVVSLSGCEIFPAPFTRVNKYTPPPLEVIVPPAEGDLSHGAGTIAQFDLSGRMAIRQGSRNDTLLIEWSHAIGSEHITMRTPLGSQVMRLDATPGHAVLALPDRKPMEAENSEPLMQSLLGFSVPIGQLALWATGEIPSDASQLRDEGEETRVLQFSKEGWDCSLQRWRVVGGQSLPGMVQVAKSDLQIRLVIDRWNVVRGNP